MYAKKNSQHDIAEILLKFTTFPLVTLSSGADFSHEIPHSMIVLVKYIILIVLLKINNWFIF
jgi:hypothetical protein